MSENNCKYIDFHSHILPQMDDGSSSVEESLEMMKISRKYGVKQIVATPHFYPDRESPETFFERRANAVKSLKEAIEASGIDAPKVYVGAEVAYFGGMSTSKLLKDLCIGGTEVILVEMPGQKWSETACEEVYRIRNTGLTPIIAHAERCLPLQSRAVMDTLVAENIGMQVNADAFGVFGSRRWVSKLIRIGGGLVLGSDCHNLDNRRPNLDMAIKIMEKKIGLEELESMTTFAESLLCGAESLN